MKVLITGGAGYIGNALVSALESNTKVEEIIVYDNLSRGDYAFFFGHDTLTKVRFVKGDILDSYKLEGALSNVDSVIHLAAHVAFPYNHLQNLQYEQINRWGTLAVVRAIQKNEAVKNVLYISSAAVYGFGENINPQSEPMPANAYGISKFEGEKYMNLLAESCRLGIIRLANVFGYNPSLRLDGVINAFFFEALTTGQIKIYGNGSQSRAFVSISNVVDGVLKWLFNSENSSAKYAIDFNATLNEIKDALLQRLPDLEYTYLNQNQEFNGQSFLLTTNAKPIEDNLLYAFTEFQENARIKSRTTK